MSSATGTVILLIAVPALIWGVALLLMPIFIWLMRDDVKNILSALREIAEVLREYRKSSMV